MAGFTPRKLNLSTINSGQRYNDGDVVSAESVNSPIEGTAYAQNVAEIAEKKANIVVRTVSTATLQPTEGASVSASTTYNGTDRTNLDFAFRIPQGKQGRSITPRGIWTNGATYSFNSDIMDTVLHNGTQYLAKLTHVASSANIPPNSTYWQVLASIGKGFVFKGAWTVGLSYLNNSLTQDLVTYNGKTYICMLSHTASTTILPTNTSYWQLVSDSGATFTPSVSSDGTLTWSNDKGLSNPPSNSTIKNSLANVNTTMSGYMQETTERVNKLEQDIVDNQGTRVTANGSIQREWNSDTKIDVSSQNVASGVATLDTSSKLVQRAVYDTSGNMIASYYLPKNNGTVTGYLALGDLNSKITRSSVSPAGNNIGVTGAMLTHYSSDEGGLLINEDGAYLWNSTDSGSLLKGFDEDNWTANTGMKKDCTFANGLMFDFDSVGNLKLKGKLYQDNGTSVALTSISASQISVTPNSNLGSATTLQGVLNYIASVFAGTQPVTKLKATTFDTN